MELRVYPRLSRDSKKSMIRQRGKYGNSHDYMPRMPLLMRLSSELNMSYEEVLEQIQKEQEYLIKNRGAAL